MRTKMLFMGLMLLSITGCGQSSSCDDYEVAVPTSARGTATNSVNSSLDYSLAQGGCNAGISSGGNQVNCTVDFFNEACQ